jgi:phosphoribosylamine--glycine ligase
MASFGQVGQRVRHLSTQLDSIRDSRPIVSGSKKVLVLGSGGREHALAHRLLASDSVGEVMVLPGNAGTRSAPPELEHKVLRNVAGSAVDVAVSGNVDLVVVGPEDPLCNGVVDELGAAGVLAFGPNRDAARLEGSKAFMKAFADRHGIPTAAYRVVRTVEEARQAVSAFDEPPVVKADGLCGGKGVVVAATHDEALQAAVAMLSGSRFGDAGRTVVIERRIAGSEASVHAICDGQRALLLPAAQDHKRIGEGDTGPNTGGMGAYAPAPLITPDLVERVRKEVVERCLAGLRADGVEYRGALFAGLMISADGEPYCLEYNVRFGDPETQVLMSVLEGDLAEALSQASSGALAPGALGVGSAHAMCVVLAAAGYPASPRTGDVITGLESAASVPGVTVFHAGTRHESGRVVTAGGRVLGITARGASLEQARQRAYRAADLVEFDGKQLRRDIGQRALGRS